MRRMGLWSVIATLCLGLCVPGGRAAEHDSPKPSSSPSWWDRLWPHEHKPEPKVEAEEEKTEKETAASASDKSAQLVEQARETREKAKADLMRRQAVCDRLQQIALETEDLDLQKRAEELNERAWSLYLKQTAHLPTIPGKEAPPTDEQPERSDPQPRSKTVAKDAPVPAIPRKEKP